MSMTTVLVVALAAPSAIWTGPLMFTEEAEDAARAPVDQQVAPLGQSEETSAAWSIQGGWTWQLKSDLTDTSSGQFTHDRGHVEPRIRLPLDSNLDLVLSGRYQRDQFGFDDMPTAIGNPWGNINTTRVGAGLQWQATRQWQVFGGGQVQWAAEQGASASDSLEGGGAIGAAYAFSRDLILGGGIGIRTRLEDGLLFYPIIVLDWNITEKLSLSTRLTTGWANRSGAELVYALEENIDVGVAAVFDYSRFRLNDDGPAIRQGGVGTVEALPLTAFVSMDITSQMSLTAYVGATVYGRLKVTDSGGSDVWASDQNPAPVLGLQGTIRF